MRASRPLAAFAAAILLAGCADRADDTAIMPADTIGTVGTGTQAAAPAAHPAGMGSTMALQPLGGSGVSGEATLTERDAQSEVMVRLTGSQPNVTHQGHIHEGTCENLGPVVAPLQPVTTDGQGSGTSTSTVDLGIANVMNGRHVISYHEAGGNPGRPITCGQILGHQM